MTKQITRQHVQTTMRDGIQLGADLFLPPGTGPFPTIVERTAHYKERDFSNPLFEFLAANRAILSRVRAEIQVEQASTELPGLRQIRRRRLDRSNAAD